MTQTRVGALAALEVVVKAAVGTALFHRDPEKPVPASASGVVIMTDGDPGAPEVILSPVSYAYEHQVELEIAANGPNRRTVVEALIAKIDPALAANRTLGGTVDDARVVAAPDVKEFDGEGVGSERSAVLRVQIAYTTASGAG